MIFARLQRRIHQLPHALRVSDRWSRCWLHAVRKRRARRWPLRAGFLQRLNFAQAHDGRELAAVHGNGFGSGGAALHGAAYDIGGDFFQIGGGGLVAGGVFLVETVMILSPTLRQ